jgi:sulfur relay (sulfurtransferase) DsrF/TusC family protein
MSQKRVLFVFYRPPFGTIHYSEGLRAAIGMTIGRDNHEVDVLYLGDGVYFALRDVDRGETLYYLNMLLDEGCLPKVEEESLAHRGIVRAEVAGDMEVVSRLQALELIAEADITFDF